MSCDVGEMTERLENERAHFTYVTTHSPTLPSLYLRHSSFYNPSVASPTSQFILQPFFRFSCVTSSSLNSPGEPVTSPTSQLILQPFRRFTYVIAHSSTLPLLHLCHSSFSNPSFASPASQALHLLHLASRPRQGHQVEAIVDLQKVLAPSLHIKLGLIKQFVKSLDKELAAFKSLTIGSLTT